MNIFNKKARASGFTIVELLIVVVIIAILAAITIVAYNGIQTKAKNSAAQSTLSTLNKKIMAYYHLKGSYPASTTTVVSTLATYPESTLPTSGIAVGTPSPTNGTTTIKVELCGAGAGVKLTPFDFSTNNLSTTITNLGSVSGTCTAATA